MLFINLLISLSNCNIKYIKLSIIITIANITLMVLSLLTQKTLLTTIINITLINQGLNRYAPTPQRHHQLNEALKGHAKHPINKKRHLTLPLAFYRVITPSLLVLVPFLKGRLLRYNVFNPAILSLQLTILQRFL